MTDYANQQLKSYVGQGVSDKLKEKLGVNFPIYNFVFLESVEVSKKEAEDESNDYSEGDLKEQRAKNNQDRADTSSTVYVFSKDGEITHITRGRDLDSEAYGTGKEKVQVAQQDQDRQAKDKQVKAGKKPDVKSPEDEMKKDLDRMVGDTPKGDKPTNSSSGNTSGNTSVK